MSKRGVCVYCATEGPVTHDHVPPLNLFPVDRRENLITVPACESCHIEFGKNDEYFRLTLAKDADLEDHPEVAKIRPVAFRALDKPQQYGLRRAIERSEAKIVLYGADGAIVHESTTFLMRLDRVSSVAARISVGLHAKFTGRIVGSDVFVGAQRCSEIRWEDDESLRMLRDVARATPPTFRVEGVYEVRGLIDPDEPIRTAWWHTFYDRVEFIALTLPRVEAERYASV